MWQKESFTSRVKLEDELSIKRTLGEEDNPLDYLKNAKRVLEKMEKNFDDALWNNPYDYFDGNLDTDAPKTEFELKARELESRSKTLYNSMLVEGTQNLLSQSKIDSLVYTRSELDELTEELLYTQSFSRYLLEGKLSVGKLDRSFYVPYDFWGYDEKDKNYEPIIEVPVWDYRFSFIALEDYNPPTTPHKIEIKDPKMRDFIEWKNMWKDWAFNIYRTDPEEMKEWLINYLAKNPDILEKYWIQDYMKLTPKQAINLTWEILSRNLEYDDFQTTFWGYFINWFFGNDNDSVPELLEGWKWVCRNYASATKVVFDSLKELQSPENNKLRNTYSRISIDIDSSELFLRSYLLGLSSKSNSRDKIVDLHTWNTFYTVIPSWDIQSVIVDIQWADIYEENKNLYLDYTKESFLFSIERLVYEWFISEEKKIKILEDWCYNNESYYDLSYKTATKEIWNYYYEKWDKVKAFSWDIKDISWDTFDETLKKYNFSEEEFIEYLNYSVSSNPELHYKLLSMYYYHKWDYAKALDNWLISLSLFSKNFDLWLIVCVSSIKIGMVEANYLYWYTPEFMYESNKTVLEKRYPKEAKIIIDYYEKNNSK